MAVITITYLLLAAFVPAMPVSLTWLILVLIGDILAVRQIISMYGAFRLSSKQLDSLQLMEDQDDND